MQGTIKDFDHDTKTGSLLLDDRTEIGIDDRSASEDQVRTLRFGQRVVFDVEQTDDGRQIARSLRLVTFD